LYAWGQLLHELPELLKVLRHGDGIFARLYRGEHHVLFVGYEAIQGHRQGRNYVLAHLKSALYLPAQVADLLSHGR